MFFINLNFSDLINQINVYKLLLKSKFNQLKFFNILYHSKTK